MKNNPADLSPAARVWIADALGSGASVTAVREMAGATSSTLYAVDVHQAGQDHRLVLRRFTLADWLAHEPDLALHEAASLRLAAMADIPTPQLIACDADGQHCGVPAILMTRLDGDVHLLPADPDRWLWQLAKALIPIHALDADTFPWAYFTYNTVDRLEVPGWSAYPDLWAAALDVVRGPRPAAQTCFIHRDYHPTNVIWQHEQISGVVDWVNACRGVPGLDLGHCRVSLSSLYGVAAADRFLDAYQTLADHSFSYHPYWDLLALIEFLPGPPYVYPPWLAYGMQGLTADLMCERMDAYLASVIQRL